ncbi:hypothetical protein Tco_1407485 [Tanacetum coccineum]
MRDEPVQSYIEEALKKPTGVWLTIIERKIQTRISQRVTEIAESAKTAGECRNSSKSGRSGVQTMHSRSAKTISKGVAENSKNQKHDQSEFMIDHNNEGRSNEKNMINLDLRKITVVKVEVTEEILIYLDVRVITSTTRNQSSSSSNGGFNRKMDQEDLKTYDKAIVIKEENVGLIPIC